MGCSTAELRVKDVILTKDGRKLGYVTDFEIDPTCGKIAALLVSSVSGGFCFRGGKSEYRIPWDKIECIGEDAILVCPGEWSSGCQTCGECPPKKRGGWLW